MTSSTTDLADDLQEIPDETWDREGSHIESISEGDQGTGGRRNWRRFALGCLVLLVVDLIWVVSSELTEYIFKTQHYDKPFFTTYFKTSMFLLYLVGFTFHRPWQKQCCPPQEDVARCPSNSSSRCSSPEPPLGNSMFVPVNDDDPTSSAVESDDSRAERARRVRTIRFSGLNEVREMPGVHAGHACVARMSYPAATRALRSGALEPSSRSANTLPLTLADMAKLAGTFALLWFLGNYCYQMALLATAAGIVNVLSSTSGLFTLLLTAAYPSSPADAFSLSKMAAVLLSLGGVVLVSLEDLKRETELPSGSLWAVGGAVLYALYLTLLRRRTGDAPNFSVPLFFGLVGLFNVLLLWPGLFILHYSDVEKFSWPTTTQWLYIVLNAIVGTVLSEALWLWGCLLTSSLVATLSLSLTIPLTMIADVFVQKEEYSWMLYVGSLPVFLGFVAVALLSHKPDVDPIGRLVSRVLECCRPAHSEARYSRLSTDDEDEQTRGLLEDDTSGVVNSAVADLADTATRAMIKTGELLPDPVSEPVDPAPNSSAAEQDADADA